MPPATAASTTSPVALSLVWKRGLSGGLARFRCLALLEPWPRRYRRRSASRWPWPEASPRAIPTPLSSVCPSHPVEYLPASERRAIQDQHLTEAVGRSGLEVGEFTD
jgi:hypothetical protein